MSVKRLEPACEIAELDEQWSYVGNKANQRWLWLAIDYATGTFPAYVFGKRRDEVFRQFQALLEPFGIGRFYSDDWGAYERNIDPESMKQAREILRKSNGGT